MHKRGICFLLGALFAASGWVNADDAPASPVVAVEAFLNAVKDGVNTPSLYGKLVAKGDGYAYTEFRSAAVEEEPWVDIFNSRAAWDSKGRKCVKRLIGKDTCPDNREDLFRKSSLEVFDSITGTVFTLGLKPFFGKMPWKANFDRDGFERARRDAESRLDHDEFKALAERYQAAWKDIIQFENDVKLAISSKSSHVVLELAGFNGSEVVSDDYFYDVVPQFRWRVTPVEASSLGEMVGQLEAISRSLSDRERMNNVALRVTCPGKRLQHLIEQSSCGVTAKWESGKVVSRGRMEVSQWKIPDTLVFDYSIKGNVLKAEFEKGLLSISNLSDSSVNIRRIDFMNAGAVRRQLIAPNSINPGKRLYYSDMITHGVFARSLEDSRVLKERHLDDEEKFGIRVLYSQSSGSATTYLTEQATLKDILLKNILSLQERGGVLEDVQIYEQGVVVLRSKANLSERNKLIELVRDHQDSDVNDVDG